MIIKIISRKADLKDDFKERVEKKLSKLEKFFNKDVIADVVVTIEREQEREKVEVTIKSNGVVYRSEKTTADKFDSLEMATDAIVKQIVKNKARLSKKMSINDLESTLDIEQSNDVIEEPEYKIVRRKLYTSKPMLEEEAILQMNMIDHDFFIFTDANTGKVNIVYKRKNGDYGLIIPENWLLIQK